MSRTEQAEVPFDLDIEPPETDSYFGPPPPPTFATLSLRKKLMWGWLEFELSEFDDWIDGLSLTPENKEWVEVYKYFRDRAIRAREGVGWGWVSAIKLLRQLYETDSTLRPAALHGVKFQPKGGSESRVKKAIRRLLAKNPEAKPAEIWRSLEARLPRGIELKDNRQGKYIEYESGGNLRVMEYARFRNAVREVKNSLKRTG